MTSAERQLLVFFSLGSQKGWDNMEEYRAENCLIYSRTLPGRKAAFEPFPEELLPEIGAFLKSRGMENLYCHQVQMFEQAMEGKNLVITTSTASGKTLSFLLPVLQKILKNPLARAIFIYPTKALANDQYRALQPYLQYFGKDRIAAGVYDGDTPANERTRIRQSANIILTNPEMVNSAFLPNHSKFGFDLIFANLEYVVIDELHTYRGAFGSHFANVLRRLHRVCRYYHASPQFLCSSATIANPVELAEGICSRPFVQIDRDGSPSAVKRYLFLQPPKLKGKDDGIYGQVPAANIASELITELVEQNTSFIAFAKSRRNVEVILKEARDRLETENCFAQIKSGKRISAADRISGYRGGYTPRERKEIENKMINGQLTGLISTNALELGIDIGEIDATVLVGYPGTRASFWQRTGRAGRSGRECNNYLILEELPFDQYVAANPNWLFETGSETAVIDKNNLLIELAHIRAAAAEIPLTLDDMALFPDLGETIPVLLSAGEVSSAGGRFLWSGESFPAGDYSLRNIDKIRFKLINEETHQVITEMDEMQAYREIHTGAVYLHDGMQYQVRKMERESRTSYAFPYQGNYYTVPGGNTEVRVIRSGRDKEYGRLRAFFGDVNVEESVHMYKKLQFHNHQNLGFEQLESPLSKNFDTESSWIRMPQNVVTTYRRILRPSDSGSYVRSNHFDGLCYALKNAARMLTMTEEEDIGAVMSSNAVGMQDEPEGEVFLYLYDKYVGGLGYAEKAYELLPRIIDTAIQMVEGCSCKGGCVACIGDYRLDKKLVLWGLQSLLTESRPPAYSKQGNEEAQQIFIKKPFSFRELSKQWPEFCQFLKEKGESHAAFLNTVSGIEIREKQVRLFAGNEFVRAWIMEDINRKELLNLIRFYTDAPQDIVLEAVTQTSKRQQEEQDRKKDKLKRRFDNLREEKHSD